VAEANKLVVSSDVGQKEELMASTPKASWAANTEESRFITALGGWKNRRSPPQSSVLDANYVEPPPAFLNAFPSLENLVEYVIVDANVPNGTPYGRRSPLLKLGPRPPSNASDRHETQAALQTATYAVSRP